MPRSPILLALAVCALALLSVPVALASGSKNRAIRVQGTCTQQSTSKMKLSSEDRGIEVEFEVDQNRSRVPWKVTLRRNGRAVASLRAVTHAPSGSFEIRRVIAGRLGTSRIVAVATRASGETCTARSSTRNAAVTTTVDDNGHDVGDDHGDDSGGHA
jgi:hypothetical protein